MTPIRYSYTQITQGGYVIILMHSLFLLPYLCRTANSLWRNSDKAIFESSDKKDIF